MDTCAEHYVVTEEEIREMIKMFAVNPDAINIDEFFLKESDIVGANADAPILVSFFILITPYFYCYY